jgi:hypothetical protein
MKRASRWFHYPEVSKVFTTSIVRNVQTVFPYLLDWIRKRYNEMNVFCHWNPQNLYTIYSFVLLQNSSVSSEVIEISCWRSYKAEETRKTPFLFFKTIRGACKRLTNFRGLCFSSHIKLGVPGSFGWQTRETACLPLQGQLESLHYANWRCGADQSS